MDGVWGIYYDVFVGDINIMVECYVVFRCVGVEKEDFRLKSVFEFIYVNGGFKYVCVFIKYWLVLIGEWLWNKMLNLFFEVIYFFKWFLFFIYNFV